MKTRQLFAIPTVVLLSTLCYLLFQHGLFWIAFQIFALVSLCATAIIFVALSLTSLIDQADARAKDRQLNHSPAATEPRPFLYGQSATDTSPSHDHPTIGQLSGPKQPPLSDYFSGFDVEARQP